MLCRIYEVEYEISSHMLFQVKDLTIQEGDCIGLVGKNGSGKSTLLSLINGDLEPTKGSIKRYSQVELLPQIKPAQQGMSGGELTQEWLKDLFARESDLILLDEPTTHLDYWRIEELERQLKAYKKPMVIVSHDRTFLNRLCNQIWEIDGKAVNEYQGNYDDYERQKLVEKQHHEKEYEKYLEQKQHLEQAIEQKEAKAARATKKPKNVSASEAKITGAKPYFAKKQKKLNKGAKALKTRLEQLDPVEKIKELPPIEMQLPNTEELGSKTLIRCEDLEGKAGDKALFYPTTFYIKFGERIAIIGENGSGKSTLIKNIMEQREEVKHSPQLKIGYFDQQLKTLRSEKTIIDNVRETSIQDETLMRTILARLGFRREKVYKKVGVLSGGERVKVALAKIFVSDVNTLVLDEPTNFLDIEALEALEGLLLEYPGTLIFVSHDRSFVNRLAKKLLIIENQQVHLFEGSLDEWQNSVPHASAVNNLEQELLVIENQISEVLGKLSLTPSEELEKEFDQLIKRKQALKKMN
ncbi:ribosomal protection-like ABC-F family protein [Alkalibacillus silvisoli]|uniref:ABC-F type ribosomal protection protein n=1 Tax=Alkalibacillus silvisoli TaxID=392823 RepID=A0ABN1A2W0_9BACI